MTITEDIRYIGVNDHETDLFEGQYILPLGMAYNSYVIMDEKIAVMDSVDSRFGEEWLDNLEKELSGRAPEYLIVQHMEPDHSGSIQLFVDKYPGSQVIASAQAFNFMKNFGISVPDDKKTVVKEGDVLSLGAHELTFVTASMVHWPEVIFTYDKKDKVLFSADAFGKFGAHDRVDPEGWDCEARRYYFGIVGKFGQQVQAVLKKAAALDIEKICPLHGPVLDEDLGYYIDKYNTWSSYTPEDSGVTIAYTSVYGHTKEAVLLLKEELEAAGCPEVELFDLARDDWAEAVEDAFRYDTLVLATTTYANDIFPFMRQFIDHLTERNYQNRKIAFIENGTWAPKAAKIMREMLEGSKDLTFAETTVTIKSAMTEENKAALKALAQEIK